VVSGSFTLGLHLYGGTSRQKRRSRLRQPDTEQPNLSHRGQVPQNTRDLVFSDGEDFRRGAANLFDGGLSGR